MRLLQRNIVQNENVYCNLRSIHMSYIITVHLTMILMVTFEYVSKCRNKTG